MKRSPAPASLTEYAPDSPQRRILDGAVEVLMERGYPDTRVSDVAERAGVSGGLVIYYFKSRQILLTRALRYAEDLFYADLRVRLDAIEHPGRRLAELVRLGYRPEDGAVVPRSWILWFDLWQLAVRHPELRREREELDRRWRDIIAGIVREGRARGQFQDVDAEDFAVMLAGLIDGLVVPLTLGDEGLTTDRAVELCLRLCAHELGEFWLADGDGGGSGRA
ncbi:TetR/AcrR family transcriptional regulator [Streptacidiphilus sp. EB103A]|uniref:TetR/AcrR family transcriptional regulator n=1 Tax=Streptacidiphilus sp. EB103A TaxID=3156275 RepID=UPI0035192B92